MKSNNSLEGCLILLFATITAMAVGAILNGFVISVVWGWFIVPIFGLPSLTIAEAVSVVIVARAVVNPVSKSDSKNKGWEDWLSDFITYSVVGPFMILGLAWIVSLFIGGGS